MGKSKRKSVNAYPNNLAHLIPATDQACTACIQTRHGNNHIYTNIGDSHLVVVNPYQPIAYNDEQTSLEYVALYKDTHPHLPQEPHLYGLINRVYFRMRRTTEDQCVILCGESGSGKTEIRQLALRHLVKLSCTKKESKAQTQVMHSQTVLHAFGTAATVQNTQATRYGYYTELQFNERGRMTGAKTLHYCLDTSHVVSRGGNNFAVFYMLLTGCDPEERRILQLAGDASMYQYLKRARPAPADASRDTLDTLKHALKAVGCRKDHVSRIFQLLAAILHLGNLIFVDPTGARTEEAAYVKNEETLALVADLVGLDPVALENILAYKTTLIRKDVTTLILNADQASLQRDQLAQCLYSLLFSWLIERFNAKLCRDEFNSYIGLLDFPGLQQSPSGASFQDFCINLAVEKIHQTLYSNLFPSDSMLEEALGSPLPFLDPAHWTDLLTRKAGICALTNTMTEQWHKGKRKVTDEHLVDTLTKYNSNHPSFAIQTSSTNARHFTVRHFVGPVTYDPTGFTSRNSSQIPIDFVSVFRGSADMPPCSNAFVAELFSDTMLAVQHHPSHTSTIVSAQPMQNLSRHPSTKKTRNDADDTSTSKTSSTVLSQIQPALDGLESSLQECNLWGIFCIRPNQNGHSTQFDSKYVLSQVQAYHLTTIAERAKVDYPVAWSHQDFLDRYAIQLHALDIDPHRLARTRLDMVAAALAWSSTDMLVGSEKVYLSFSAWHQLENQMRAWEKDGQRQARDTSKSMQDPDNLRAVAVAAGLPPPIPASITTESQRSFYSDDDYQHDMTSTVYQENDESYYGTESYGYSNETETKAAIGTIPLTENLQAPLEDEDEDKQTMTAARKRWLFFVWAVTWWIPNQCLVWCGKMKRKDVRIAWREKVALCTIILFMCGFVIWFLVFFGELVCPHQQVFSETELQAHDKHDSEKTYVAIRGEVFDLGGFAPRHYLSGIIPTEKVLDYGGKDATDLFPVQVSALCEGISGEVSPYVSLDYRRNLSDTNGQYHDFRFTSQVYEPNWYYNQISMLRRNYKVGHMAYESKAVHDQATTATKVNDIKTTRNWAILDNHVYDLTAYTMGGRYAAGPPGELVPSGIDTNFMETSVVNLFWQKSGTDITKEFYALKLDGATKQRQLVCLRNLFFVGMLDTRNSAKCQFSTYLLLIVTCLLASVIVFKFLAALRISSPRAPEEHDKFVICQITCYTEDEESLRKTIDSIATLTYDDKRKLMFIICDGMIIGSGNDLPTPRIVLNILGVDAHVDPEPLSFVSVGEGQKQHNMGKIYSGLYEVSGHVVPYIVVVKCGKPTERQKPGNRGKRDSQLILMQFLNRVHHDAPMNPLQLEVYHQMKNVIGVSPSFYEFVLMVDADTEVMPTGLNYLVSSMVHDSKIIGICGETTLANEKDTWVTMIQVYEYFISHHMIKAFESLFSTVSCLPGCFTMYRVRTVDKKRALFVSNEVIADYSVNVVDTLHKKNLLHLGEDRYLTTLLLKHFPHFKTKFTADAQCKTNAPDLWSVLVSQRRRWINSTIHNLGELVFLPQLCGFCCFSMRFVVMLDLISTLVMPAIMGYLGYLIYTLATYDGDNIPIISIATIAGTYGLQALLFILKRKWEYIGWMLVSILAIPVFSFYIPIYAYWHFDDFSWGNTRVVVGEKGRKVAVADEGEFDPKTIPTMTWAEYETSLLGHDWNDSESYYSSPQGTGPLYGSTIQLPPPTAPSMQSGIIDHALLPSAATSLPGLPLAPVATAPSVVPRSMASRPVSAMTKSTSANLMMNRNRQSLVMDGFALNDAQAGPNNEQIFTEIKRILSVADLTQITKKQVREELQAIFGVSMAGKKDYINMCIEHILQGGGV
ncbi:chitin synthase-domain-containing protein [Radiomyces spectabilis]|uniref:chitin synthase-domain-containing protein n=1 Tax=Radiomyces spectabilis TaxID=64574 RepID=UPI0022208A72|nr:chitin synthase-domain-containing protein [Radiomyces spectabilis]KAI8373066.1 chitin synthase-domain-containing protein [Radiomyces spectabilis]